MQLLGLGHLRILALDLQPVTSDPGTRPARWNAWSSQPIFAWTRPDATVAAFSKERRPSDLVDEVPVQHRHMRVSRGQPWNPSMRFTVDISMALAFSEAPEGPWRWEANLTCSMCCGRSSSELCFSDWSDYGLRTIIGVKFVLSSLSASLMLTCFCGRLPQWRHPRARARSLSPSEGSFERHA
jgi:hypothetical protein